MPPSIAKQPYVCLSCIFENVAQTSRAAGRGQRSWQKISTNSTASFHHNELLSTVTQRKYSSETTPADSQGIKLTAAHISRLGRFEKLRQRIDVENPQNGVPIDTLLSAIKPTLEPGFGPYIGTLEQVYSGQGIDRLKSDLDQIAKNKVHADSLVEDQSVKELLTKLGVVRKKSKKATKETQETEETGENKAAKKVKDKIVDSTKSRRKRKARTLKIRKVQTHVTSTETDEYIWGFRRIKRQGDEETEEATAKDDKSTSGPGRPAQLESKVVRPLPAPEDAVDLDTTAIVHTPIELDEAPNVPQLSFNLSRVLFNPGVYQLQDPRSRVFNFDPYLADIMPVQQFNFDALNEYITSSEDETLKNIAMKHGKRYTGSSSSMSGVLSHFHFLLSAWRPISIASLSQNIPNEVLKTFTVITRAPAAIYLRWRDGVYGVDADKEFDSGNILMILGRSMEKLLTLEKDDFEKFRIQNIQDGEEPPKPSTEPEAYHYQAAGDFLLRSQLDAHDPRLPGTGMFDLKTRAVAGIRMDMQNWQHGMNYQIKDRIGLWESYEREYYDMIRAAFLKYSLQVRMGRMDGIFVAYHNISRLFGFQYIPLPELDQALHGQADGTVGDREFRSSIELLNKIFDEATTLFPEQTLRFIFETRDATTSLPNGHMQIFAEVVDDEEVVSRQAKAKAVQAEFENKTLGRASTDTSSAEEAPAQVSGQPSAPSPSTFESSEADVDFLNELAKDEAKPEEDAVPRKLASWRLTVYNEVNGKPVTRPENITDADRWNVKYTLEQRNEQETQRLYQTCMNRRQAAFEPRGDKSWFIKKLVEMSAQGKVWREQQDKLDAGKEQVVL